MDNKFYVSLDAARLLKEKGYNEDVTYLYNSKCELQTTLMAYGCDLMPNEEFDNNDYAAPTKSEAIDWLESNGIMISVVYDNLGIIGKKHYRSIIDTLDKDGSESGLPIYLPSYDGDIRHYSTRLEAEEAAIIKALELL